MKTVMKKMFCLMLVAVLLVSAVPAAFADTTYTVEVEISGAATASATVQAATSDTVNSIYSWVADKNNINTGAFNATFEWAGAVTNGPVDSSTPIGEDGKLMVELTAAAHDHVWSSGVTTKAPTCTENGEISYTCSICGHVHKDTTHESVKATGHTPGAAATCTTAQKCATCGAELAAATGHTPGAAATCTTAQKCTSCGTELESATGHDYDTNGVCQNGCGASETGTHEVYFSVNGDQEYWHLGVKHNATVAEPGFTYGTDYTYLESVGDTATQKFLGWSKNPSDTTGSKLADIVRVPVTQSVTYYAIYQAKQTTTTPDDDDTSNDGGNGGSTTTPNYPTGSRTLHVWANVYIGGTLEKEILLTDIEGVSGSAFVVDVMSAHRSDINAEINSDRFADYHGAQWDTQVYYYKVKDGEYKEVGSKLTVGEDNDVYLNVYSAEKLVVVNVHTRKSYSTDLSIRIRGKRIGDVVSYEDVKDAVKKYYNVSSLSIYEYDEWCKVVEDEDASKTYSFKVKDGDNVYEVYLTGSRKSGTYTYTADSTNPKTGDAVFTPVIVMGASVTALAVLFFLNKKRAIV